MHEDNQVSPEGATPADDVIPLVPESFDATHWAHTTRGLTAWFLILVTFGVGGLLLGQEELAVLSAGAGLFVAAQAADLDYQWRMLHYLLTWVVPAAGLAVFVALAYMMASTPLAGSWGPALVVLCIAGAALSLVSLVRPFSAAVASFLFRTPVTSHTQRLAARLVLICLLFAVPGWFAIRNLFDDVTHPIGSLIDPSSLGTGLIGYVLLSLASVGFMLRRDRQQSLERLGIEPIQARHLIVIGIGVASLYLLNSTADAIQKRFFHELWVQDQHMSEAIGGNLGLAGTIVLGLSAGIGEEITMRGALQPQLGLIGTSLVFASLHVQYSWYGMGVIFLLGMLLGTIRQRANTSVAMAVHALYDIAAVFSVGKN